MLDFGAVIKHTFFQVDEAATQALMDLRIHSPIVAFGQKKARGHWCAAGLGRRAVRNKSP
jgi:hypothetical protein